MTDPQYISVYEASARLRAVGYHVERSANQLQARRSPNAMPDCLQINGEKVSASQVALVQRKVRG